MDRLSTLDAFLQHNRIEALADVPMSEYTTFRIGGPCARMVLPSSEEQIGLVFSFCAGNGIPVCLIGNGSNLLVADEGIDGVVVQLGRRFSAIRLGDDGTSVVCEAGAQLAKVCAFARDHGLTGLEFAYGIPGSVGGAVYMNAGAYGGEMKDVVESCRFIDAAGKPGERKGEALRFSYRRSVFSEGSDCVTEVCFRLRPGDPEKIAAAMEEILERRRRKQPLELPSAGSAFKRPREGYASALIDRCGLKGFRCGGAQVSEKHAGFIVNAGGATCKDVLTLMSRVAETVKEATGITLEPEIKLLP